MPEVENPTQANSGIFTHSLGEYREKVGEIIRKENERLNQLAQDQAKGIIDNAQLKADDIILQAQKRAATIVADSEKKAEGIIADSQKNAMDVGNAIEQQANQRSIEVTENARKDAQRIIQEAEESAKKEAKNRIKSQEKKIIDKAKEEADSLLNEAKENAEKESTIIKERIREETEKGLEEEVAKFRADAHSQTAQICIEAEKKATKMIDDVVDDIKEINRIIIESITKSENILGKFSGEMKAEAGELAGSIATVRQKLEKKITNFNEKVENVSPIKMINLNPANKSALWVTLKGEQSKHTDNGSDLFKGFMELKTLSPIDHLLIKRLKHFLIQIPNVIYLGESSGEEGTMLSFEMKEPLPLLEVLNNIPLVESVETQGDNIKLILN